MQDPRETEFQSAKAFAHFEGIWPHCTHSECRKRKQCCGGPRGTRRRSGGILLCKQITSGTTERKLLHDRKSQLGEEPIKSNSEPEWFAQTLKALGV